MILARDQYEAVAKYRSDNPVVFDRIELAMVYCILNICDPLPEFEESSLSQYIEDIERNVEIQNERMTVIFSKFLQLKDRGLEMEAYSELIKYIGEIRSIFMLDILVGVLGGCQFGSAA